MKSLSPIIYCLLLFFTSFTHAKEDEPKLVKVKPWWYHEINANGSFGQHHPELTTALMSTVFLAHGESVNSKNFGPILKPMFEYLSQVDIDKLRPLDLAIYTYTLQEFKDDKEIPTITEKRKSALKKLLEISDDGKKLFTTELSPSPIFHHYALLTLIYVKSKTENQEKLTTYFVAIRHNIQQSLAKLDKNSTAIEIASLVTASGLLAKTQSELPRKEVLDTFYLYSKKMIAQPDNYSVSEFFFFTHGSFYINGKTWEKWNEFFQNYYNKSQLPEGFWAVQKNLNELHLNTQVSKMEKRFLSTSLIALQLAVYYRYISPTSYRKYSPSRKKTTRPTPPDENIDDGEFF